jgi:hypothetical protein
MAKTSTEYAELMGLYIAVSNLKSKPKPDTQAVISWMEDRIKILEQK